MGEIAELLRKLELGVFPDEEIRRLVKIELERRLQWGYKPPYEQQVSKVLSLVHSLRRMSIGTEMEELNSEMYELPISFLKIMFGRTIKQSCCYFKDESTTLEEAEEAMLELYCERAQIKDGQRVLDLGCGYGSLTLHLAQKYQNCHITGLTNSISQKQFIEEQCSNCNLSNVEIILADITTHEMNETFDRVMIIGLFEHMKNYELLLRKISKWMEQDGLLFVDHICHKSLAYLYEPLDEDDWLAECTWPAGSMIIPSAHFLLYFQDDVSVLSHWVLNGKHCSHTNEEWLKRLDANADAVKTIMEPLSGSKEGAIKSTNYWRTLLLFAIELYGYNNGEEWMVAHLLFKKK